MVIIYTKHIEAETHDIFKNIFLNENVWISIKISLKFVSKGPINNIPTLVQIMAWRQLGDKPSSEPIMVSLLIYIYTSLSLSELTHLTLNKMAAISQMSTNAFPLMKSFYFHFNSTEVCH